MTIRLWRGYHEPQLLAEIKNAWEQDDLLIVCPPLLHDFSFLQSLPPGPIEFCGDWTDFSRSHLAAARKEGSNESYPSQPVLGVFTSGTLSGSPRLVLYSKTNVESSIESISQYFDFSRVRTLYCYPQPFHTFGLVLGYVMALQKGLSLITPNGRYDRKAHEIRVQCGSSDVLTLGTPTHFYDLIEFVKSTGHKLTPSYSCIIGGAPVTVELWKQIRDVLQIEMPSIGYGCTEASPGISHHPPGLVPLEDGEIGFPLNSLTAQCDSENGVTIQGPSLCLAMIEKGQLQFPVKTAIRDRIRQRADGMWIYEGRLDLMLNRGGQKVSLEAIEHLVLMSTGLQVVAMAVPHLRLGHDLALLVKWDAASVGYHNPADFSAIQSAIEKHFSFKLNPDLIRTISDFPYNSSFKLDRRTAQNLFKEEPHELSSKIS